MNPQEKEEGTFRINGKTATLLSVLALAVGGGGTFYATQGGHRYTQDEANRDVAILVTRIENLERTIQLFSVSGPSEVRRSLERIESKIDRIQLKANGASWTGNSAERK